MKEGKGTGQERMDRVVRKGLEKARELLRWIWTECRDVRTAALLLTVMAVMYFPVWGGYLLHALFGWKTGSVIASACLLFWAGPFTPFFPLCIGITFAIKRQMERNEGVAGRRRMFRRRRWFVVPLQRG